MKKGQRLVAFLWITASVLLLFNREVYAQDKTVNAIHSPWYVPAAAIEVHVGESELHRLLEPYEFQIYTTDGETFSLPVKWDYSTVNFHKTGAYSIFGTIQMPRDYQLAKGIALPTITTGVSVQKKETPDINAVSLMGSAGVYYFPWLERQDTSDMEAYLKRGDGNWVNLMTDGFAMCDCDGLYLSNQSLIPGNRYSLVVSYSDKLTKILSFDYDINRVMKCISYEEGKLGDIAVTDTCIASYEQIDPEYLKRCASYAVTEGGSLDGIIRELERDMRILASTSAVYENTPENPAVILTSAWDTSEVNTKKTGVYRICGSFLLPEGYTLKEGLDLPEAYAYISVQKKGEPQIDTYWFPAKDAVVFPMILTDFSDIEKRQFQIYLQEDKKGYKRLNDKQAVLEDNGLRLTPSEVFRNEHTYELYMEYPDGSTGIYSFTYKNDSLLNGHWNGRNFADRVENHLPDIVQKVSDSIPSDQIPSENTADPASASDIPAGTGSSDSEKYENNNSSENVFERAGAGVDVTERSSDDTTVISGSRLKIMMQDAGLYFEKEGIVLCIPNDVAEIWKVRDQETIQVMIQKTSETSFSVRIYVRDEEIMEIPGAKVKIPMDSFSKEMIPDEMTVEDAQGELCESIWLEKQNLCEISISKTGDYFLCMPEIGKIENETMESLKDQVDTCEKSKEESVGDSEENDKSVSLYSEPEDTQENREIIKGMYPGVVAAGALAVCLLLFAAGRIKKKKG